MNLRQHKRRAYAGMARRFIEGRPIHHGAWRLRIYWRLGVSFGRRHWFQGCAWWPAPFRAS